MDMIYVITLNGDAATLADLYRVELGADYAASDKGRIIAHTSRESAIAEFNSLFKSTVWLRRKEGIEVTRFVPAPTAKQVRALLMA